MYAEYKQNILGLIEVNEDEAKLFGNYGKVEIQYLRNNSYLITGLQDKEPGTFDLAGLEQALRT